MDYKKFFEYYENRYKERKDVVTIDGLQVTDYKKFNITEEWLLHSFLYFNKKYFNNAIPNDTNICIMRTTNNYFGVTHVVNKSFIEDVGINCYLGFTEKLAIEVLLHEMIHVYLISIKDKGSLKNQGHGISFIEKMNEINSYGWDVKVSSPIIQTEQTNMRFSKDRYSIEEDFRILIPKDYKEKEISDILLFKTDFTLTKESGTVYEIKNGTTFAKYISRYNNQPIALKYKKADIDDLINNDSIDKVIMRESSNLDMPYYLEEAVNTCDNVWISKLDYNPDGTVSYEISIV